MKILVVTRRYFPHGDANSVVTRNLVNELIRQKHTVHVAAVTSYQEDEKITEWEGATVSNIYIPETKDIPQIKREWKQNPVRYAIICAKEVMSYIVRKSKKEYKQLSLYPPLVKAYKKLFVSSWMQQKYDICLMTLMPQEAVWVALKKKLGYPYAVYMMDPYWNQYVYPDQYQAERFEFEKELIINSVFTMATPIIYSIDTQKDERLRSKLISVEFPMITEPSVNNSAKESSDICHCVFLGTLYAQLRPPEKIVRIISKINNPNICFDFYGSGQQLIEQSEDYQNAKEAIHLFGSVSTPEAHRIMSEADVLVNIDNTSGNQVPSKIFEYISTGKPIINFVFYDDSPILEHMKKYPLCLNINVNKTSEKEAGKLIIEFIIRNKEKIIPYENVRRIYKSCTPEYVVDQFISACREARIT